MIHILCGKLHLTSPLGECFLSRWALDCILLSGSPSWIEIPWPIQPGALLYRRQKNEGGESTKWITSLLCVCARRVSSSIAHDRSSMLSGRFRERLVCKWGWRAQIDQNLFFPWCDGGGWKRRPASRHFISEQSKASRAPISKVMAATVRPLLGIVNPLFMVRVTLPFT